MKNYTIFYIVRHGETQWNVDCKMQGHLDIPLNDRGRIQAKDVAKKLRSIHFDLAFSSDLVRAKETAEIIALERKLAVKTTKLLREKYFGKHQGKTYDQYNSDLKKTLDQYNRLSQEQRYRFKIDDDIETDEEFFTRFLIFIRETAVAYPGKTILVATHGGLMRYMLVHLGFGTYEELRWGAVTNTAYVKLKTDGVDFFIEETFGVVKNRY